MTLHTNNIKLRPLEPEDLSLLYLWENTPALWQVSHTLAPFSRYVLQQYLADSHRDIFEAKQLRLIIESTEGKAVGAMDLFDFDPNHRRAGLGILIYAAEDRARGYAADAVQLMCGYVREVLGMHQLYANVSADNQASIRLFERCGFQLVGVKKEWLRTAEGWIDELMYQKVFG